MKTVAYSYGVLPRWVLPATFRVSGLSGSVLALLAATNGPVPGRAVSEVHALHSRDRVGATGGRPPVGRPAQPAPLRQAGPALHALPVLLHPGAVHLHRLAQHMSAGSDPETAGRRRARPLTQNLSPFYPPGRPGQGGVRAPSPGSGASEGLTRALHRHRMHVLPVPRSRRGLRRPARQGDAPARAARAASDVSGQYGHPKAVNRFTRRGGEGRRE